MKIMRFVPSLLLGFLMLCLLPSNVMAGTEESNGDTAQQELAEEVVYTSHIYIPIVMSSNNASNEATYTRVMPIAETQTFQVLEDEAQAAGLCIRVPWGPGKVNWHMSSPSGDGYSVKPEGSTSLVWGSPPSQNIDGIYRSSWGSCNALKVPDSCTANVYSGGSIGFCCNAAAWVAGKRPKWVNTCSSSSPEAGWPDHPLN